MDQIEDLYEDLAELMEDNEEIQEMMGKCFSVEYDESELEGELAELDEEIINEQLDARPAYVPIAPAKAAPQPMMNMWVNNKFQNILHLSQ